MSESDDERERREGEFARRVGSMEARRMRARRRRGHGLWYGLGMFGLVGWSVALPTVIALALGVWLDSRGHGRYSWTLMLLVAGIAIGCFNAWHWVRRESSNGE